MTISSHSRSPSLLDEAAPAAQNVRASDARAAWQIWAMLVVAIGAIYLVMFNPYWVPGGDSELYIAVGRSWAIGLRHTFNGQFVSISPPGWPLLMAAAMKISPTFGLLKLITITCMTFTMGFWYWFLIRFTTPKHAALLTLICAIISHVYSLSFWMHSDALFCLIATAAMVVACQINEGKPHLIWRIILLSLLCIAAQFVRWAGALQWIMVGGVLMAGQSLPLIWRFGQWGTELRKFSTRQWAAVAVSFLVTVGTFSLLRHELHLTAQQEADAKDAGVTFDEQQTPEAKTVDIFNGKQSTKLTFAQEMSKRVRDSGKWFSWLFWPEMRFVGGSGVKGVLNSLDCLIGWLIIAAIFVCGWTHLRRCQWLWLAVFVYCAFLCLNWPNPNARYLVPILPIILWGTLEGIRIIFAHFSRMKWGSRLAVAMLASIALANSALLAVDAWVARSHDFYSRYEGGMNQGLISAVRYLNERGLGDGDLAVSEIYTNLGKRRISKAGLRAAVMLSDQVVKSVPDRVGDDVTRGKFLAWARSKHVKWYLYQAPISPWRLWHFRVPAWLQKALSHEEVPPESGGWVLYRYVPPVNSWVPLPMSQVVTLVPGKWVKVDVPISHHWPTRVPGM